MALVSSQVPAQEFTRESHLTRPHLPQDAVDGPIQGWGGNEAGKGHARSKCGPRPQARTAPGVGHEFPQIILPLTLDYSYR